MWSASSLKAKEDRTGRHCNLHCGIDDQTPEHVLQACPLSDDQRKEVWPVGTNLETKLADNLRLTTRFTTSVGLQISSRPVERRRRRTSRPDKTSSDSIHQLIISTRRSKISNESKVKANESEAKRRIFSRQMKVKQNEESLPV